mmetsp:Transcript_6335/g.11238  ORF Transcript_6335/g.11238 Transcript_6335/m.11238 type:complete len:378 (-) Transcript_6335:55-1188(-)
MVRKSLLDVWEAQVVEEAIDQDRVIVDPHHHLWDPVNEPRGAISLGAKFLGCMSNSWRKRLTKYLFPKAALDAFGYNTMAIDKFLTEELRAQFKGHNVVQSVAIEAGWEDKSAGKAELRSVGETAKFHKMSLDGGFPHAAIGFIDLRVGKERTKAAIAKHREVNPNLRGFRHQLSWHKSKAVYRAPHAEEGLTRKENFRGGIEAIQEAGLIFEIWCYHTQLDEAAELVAAFPGMQFVLNHVGTPLGLGPYKGEAGRAKAKTEWEGSITKIAAYPNVVVKLSGLFMPFCGFDFDKAPKPPTSDEVLEQMLPYFTLVFQLFGVERCMFASNFPVDRISCSYVVLYNAFKKLCDKLELDDEGKDKLFCLNARRVYSLEAI